MGVTGLLPIIFLPLFGILNGGIVSSIYFSDAIMVCLGSLIMADAIEVYSIHDKFAKYLLNKMSIFGNSGLIAGFVFTTGLLSMFLSNTATAALMTTLSKAVLMEVKQSNVNYNSIGIDLIYIVVFQSNISI